MRQRRVSSSVPLPQDFGFCDFVNPERRQCIFSCARKRDVQKPGQVFRRCPPEHCTLTLDVKLAISNVSIFDRRCRRVANRMCRFATQNRFFAATNKMCCIAARKNRSLVGRCDLSERKTAV
jgi:hypothetical protein